MNYKQRLFTILGAFALATSLDAGAQVLPQAAEVLRIALATKPTSRPMTVAYVPDYSRYYIADGGLAPMADEFGMIMSKSQIHAYGAKGEYLHSVKPGLDNRSLYYNPNSRRLESVTYNISSDVGMSPLSGIYAIGLDESGTLTARTDEIIGSNPAFGNSGTMPSFDPAQELYYAKQQRSPKVLLVKAKERAPVGEITLDLGAAGAKTDEVSEYFVAFTGIAGEELALLDIDHKAVLVFDSKGKFVGKSALPATMKLRANNHYSGLGYANGLFFVYHEPEGEFGTYYGFRISDQAK